jgi:hypothetical protein
LGDVRRLVQPGGDPFEAIILGVNDRRGSGDVRENAQRQRAWVSHG